MISSRTDRRLAVNVKHRWITVAGIRIFYREAGPEDAPTVLLLHGFPSSSHMFRHLIPALADRCHVIAPDYPAFGYSDVPDDGTFRCTFENYARVMHEFMNDVGVERYLVYLQDYGAPVGLRLALLAPERILALVIQNGNAYEEGLSQQWDPLRAYWTNPTPAGRQELRGWLTPEGVRLQYSAGLNESQIRLLSPDTWTVDWALLSRPGILDVQLDLFADYRTNVALYPQFQRFFRERQPPALIVWGERDPFFTVAGAKAYLRDLPHAELHLLDAGHFALETHGHRIAALMRDFVERRVMSEAEPPSTMSR
jgi:pimeloyl-ACP methyl ester carboxylesterase